MCEDANLGLGLLLSRLPRLAIHALFGFSGFPLSLGLLPTTTDG